MSYQCQKDVPQIAVTTYESNEDDAEIINYLNSPKIRNNLNAVNSSGSFNDLQQKTKMEKKCMTLEDGNLNHSLSPVSTSDINFLTDIEAISDSDDENNFVRNDCLSPSLQRFYVLTDIEDLSEDEKTESLNNTNEKQTECGLFIGKLDDLKNDSKEKKYFEDILNFPQPQREILFYSRDGVIRALTPINDKNSAWIKSPREKLEGFESEEEVVTVPENSHHKPRKDSYHHDDYSGVVSSSEIIKKYQNKQKSRVLVTKKKSLLHEADFMKKRVHHKRQNSNDGGESFEKKMTESLKTTSKSLSAPILNNMMQSTGVQINNKNCAINHRQECNKLNKLIIHDNINDFNVSFNFDCQNAVILNIGRDSENLSIKWYKNESASGRINSRLISFKNLKLITTDCYTSSSNNLEGSRYLELCFYKTIRIHQCRCITYFVIYINIKPLHTVQYYRSKQFLIEMPEKQSLLVNFSCFNDKFMKTKQISPTYTTRLSSNKVFNEERKVNINENPLVIKPKNRVIDVVQMFESLTDKYYKSQPTIIRTVQYDIRNSRMMRFEQNVGGVSQLKKLLGKYFFYISK